MTGFSYLNATALAALFLFAGIAKIVQLPLTKGSFQQLGLPFGNTLAVVVPIIEIALALVLIIRPAIGAIAALVLLGLFTAVVLRALLSGVQGGCGCFGATANSQVSSNDIVRNGLLAGAAVLATGAADPAKPEFYAYGATTIVWLTGALLLAVWDNDNAKLTPLQLLRGRRRDET